MSKKLRNIWIIVRNVIILFLILEIALTYYYDLKMKNEYKDYITMKIDANIHPKMSAEDVREMYDEYLDIEMQWMPFTHISPKPFKAKYNNIDTLGHRKTTQYKSSPKNANIKVFCFGGSTMYSLGAADNTTIASLLTIELGKKFPNKNFSVTNFGTIGYNREEEAIQLKRELLKGNIPDIAIFFDGVNDVFGAYQNKNVTITQNAYNRQLEFNASKTYKKKTQLLLKSSGINRLIKYFQRKTNPISNTINAKTLSKEIASNYQRLVFHSDVIAKTYDFKVFNFLQPTIFTKKELTTFEIVMKENQAYLEPLYNHTYKAIIKDSTLNQSSSYADISNAFNSTNTNVYTDFCHTTEIGNAIIAKKICSYIDTSLLSIAKDSIN